MVLYFTQGSPGLLLLSLGQSQIVSAFTFKSIFAWRIKYMITLFTNPIMEIIRKHLF